MGVLKFRLTPPELAERLPELQRSYVTGLDRTPERLSIELRHGLMICSRESPESGKFHVPWPVPEVGLPYVSTATLVERAEPYDLAVELARGKLNDVRTQAAEWVQLGLRMPAEVEKELAEARRNFAKAATSRDRPEQATASAQLSLSASFRAARKLTEAYTAQVLRKRLENGSKLPTLLACGLGMDPSKAPWAEGLPQAFNAGRIQCHWGMLAPGEGEHRWSVIDSQLDWCQRNNLQSLAGPILDLRPSALPDWLWLWAGDADSISGMALDLVRQVVSRYKGLISTWHLVGRPSSSEVLGLSQEEQVRLTARMIQAARQIDPATPMVVDFDRPWAEWLSQSSFQLGPLHIADSLARAELGLSGIGLEVAPGYGPPGSHLRDLLEFSKLLDLYAFLQLPLHVTIVVPSAVGPDPMADTGVVVEAGQWPTSLSEELQQRLASSWISLAVAKPYVRSVCWKQVSDSIPHVYPNGGLFRADGGPKKLVSWIQDFRRGNLT